MESPSSKELMEESCIEEADDTIAYHTADEDDNSKYLSIISDTSDLDGNQNSTLDHETMREDGHGDTLTDVLPQTDINPDADLDGDRDAGVLQIDESRMIEADPEERDERLEPSKVVAEEENRVLDVSGEAESMNVLDDLSSVDSKTVEKTEDSEAGSRGASVFDDNENSVDEHDLVIDDDAMLSEKTDDIREDGDSETMNLVSDENDTGKLFNGVDLPEPKSDNQSDGKPVSDASNETVKEDEPEEKIDNYSALLQGALPEGSSVVMLQMEDKTVEAVHIGDGVYIYKNNDGNLTAIQIIVENGVTNIKPLHVGKNEDGNLEVYEEEINQVAITKEELEAMKRQEQISKAETDKEKEQTEPNSVEPPIIENKASNDQILTEQPKDSAGDESVVLKISDIESDLDSSETPTTHNCLEVKNQNIDKIDATPPVSTVTQDFPNELPGKGDEATSVVEKDLSPEKTEKSDVEKEDQVLCTTNAISPLEEQKVLENSLSIMESLSDDGYKESDDMIDDNRLQIVEEENLEVLNDNEVTEDDHEQAPISMDVEEDKDDSTLHISEDEPIDSLQLDTSHPVQPINKIDEKISSDLIVDKEILSMGVEIRDDGIALLSNVDEVNSENHKFVTLLENDGVVTLSIKNNDYESDGNDLLAKMEANSLLFDNEVSKDEPVANDKSVVPEVIKEHDNSFESQSSIDSDDDDIVEGEPVTGDSELGWMTSLQNVADVAKVENTVKTHVNNVNEEKMKTLPNDVDEPVYISIISSNKNCLEDNEEKIQLHSKGEDTVNPVIMEMEFDKFVRRNSFQLLDNSPEKGDKKDTKSNDIKKTKVSDDKIEGDMPAVKAISHYSPTKAQPVASAIPLPYESATVKNECENMFSNRLYSNHIQPKTYLQRNRTPYQKKISTNSILTNMNLNNSKVDNMKLVKSPEKESILRVPYNETKVNVALSCTSTPKLKTYPAPQKKNHERDLPSLNSSNKVGEHKALFYNPVENSDSKGINLAPVSNSTNIKRPVMEEGTLRPLKDLSETNLSCMSISDTEHQSSADESNTSEPMKHKSRHPRKQVFTPVAQSDIEIVFSNVCNMAKNKSATEKPYKKYKIFSAKQAQLEAEEKLLHEKNSSIPVSQEQLGNDRKEMNLTDNTEKSPVNQSPVKADAIEGEHKNNSKEIAQNDSDSSIVKRKRGRPRKVLSTSVDSSSVSSASMDSSPIVNKIMEIERKRLSPQLRKLAPSRLDNVTERSKSLSPFGKINESIVCPICLKTFRTQNVLLKHVKHCTGVIEKEPAKTPKKRKSELDEDYNSGYKTKDKNNSPKAKSPSEVDAESPKKKPKPEDNPCERDNKNMDTSPKSFDKISNNNSPSFNKKTKVLNCYNSSMNKGKDINSSEAVNKISNEIKDIDKTTSIVYDSKSPKYVSSIPDQIKYNTTKDNLGASAGDSISPKKIEGTEDTKCINPKKLMLQKSIIESEARESKAAQTANQISVPEKIEMIKTTTEKIPLKNNPRKSIIEKPKLNTINKKLSNANKPAASPMSRLAKILNKKPPPSTTISCEICGKTFRQLAHMVYHRNKHSIDERSAIEKPDKSKKPEEASKPPVNEQSEENSILKCEVCQKGFRKLHHLVEHREVHLTVETKSRRASTASLKSEPEAGFRCDTCDKSFRKLHHLVEHRELHTTEANDSVAAKPVKELKDETTNTTCTGCGKSFRKRHHMVEHREIHCSPNKKSKGNDVDQPDDFNVRLSIASTASDESNNCGICGKSYRKLHHMVEHRESHNETNRLPAKTESELMKTKDIIHECAKCYMVFPNENSLNKHSTICAKRKLINQKRAVNEPSPPQNDVSRRLEFEKGVKPRKPSSVLSSNAGDEDDDDVIILTDDIETVHSATPQPLESNKEDSVSTVVQDDVKINDIDIPKPVKNPINKIKKVAKALKEKPDPETDVKYQINPDYKKPKRRLSQPIQTKIIPITSNIRGRKSESNLPNSKLPVTKPLKTIVEESDVRYSFAKSSKPKDKNSSDKDKINEKDKPEKTDSKIIPKGKIPEKRRVGRPSLKPPQNSTKAIAKTTQESQQSAKTIVKKKLVNKQVSLVINKRRSLGGRKSIEGRKLPGLEKKEVVKNTNTAIIQKKNLKENRMSHKCDCGKTFENEVLLKRHMDSEHTPPKSFNCSTCGASVRTASQYAKHKQDHLKEQNKKASQSTASNIKKAKVSVKDVGQQKKGGFKTPENSSKTISKKKNPETSVKKSVKRKSAHSGVPLSDKMKKAIAGAKF